MNPLFLIASLLTAVSVAAAPPSPSGSGRVRAGAIPVLPFPGETTTLNLIEWSSNDLPKVYERSDQLPLTDEEVAKLAKAGFDAKQMVKMIEERRCACDASADGLIKLKNQGVPQEVLSAISLHGLQPNRHLDLLLTLDFSGEGNQSRERFLYFFIDDGDLTRVFTANIADMLGRKFAHEKMVDQSDLLIARQVRRVQLAGQVPLKTYGKHTVLVASSGNPTLTHPSQLSAAERSKAQTYTFEYPRVSLENVCRLTAGYRRDVVLAHQWNFMGSRFECEWN